ncbi:peptidase M4 [Ornithinibacillus sp. L9]|uniref:Peptidase M4 n=1 Tax=Ornithinibacillus caprae TaxID=2678566 RepID=A0A6N8FHL1_9BACI|nr:PepSY domain-containing protein [Ornithinibacillus caprae]MUK86798.1 peptidase M4 [Ornithinibacillus caprae]
MGMRRAVLAAGLGVAVGYLAKQQMDRYQKVTPEKALKLAKETFKKQGPISGSWIYMKPEDVVKNGLSYTAYRGGITRSIDGKNKQYEFLIDVESGAVIDAFETA